MNLLTRKYCSEAYWLAGRCVTHKIGRIYYGHRDEDPKLCQVFSRSCTCCGCIRTHNGYAVTKEWAHRKKDVEAAHLLLGAVDGDGV